MIANGLVQHISLAQVCEPGGARVRDGSFSSQIHEALPGQSARLPRSPNMEPLRHTFVVRFGTYEVSFQSGEVRKAGVRIRVQQQPLKLLEVLLERPGEVVTREELRSRVWPNESFGDFDQAVNIAIAKLRSALGDSAENPRYIETLPKRGYRFIADVSFVDPDGRIRRPESASVRRDWEQSLGTSSKANGFAVPAETEPGHQLQGPDWPLRL